MAEHTHEAVTKSPDLLSQNLRHIGVYRWVVWYLIQAVNYMDGVDDVGEVVRQGNQRGKAQRYLYIRRIE
jgi:hypothetical protein